MSCGRLLAFSPSSRSKRRHEISVTETGIVAKRSLFKHTFGRLLLLRLLLVLLDLLGDLFPLLLLHVAVEVLKGVVEGGGEHNLSVFAKLIPDLNEELLQFHGVFKYLGVGPDKEKRKGNEAIWTYRTKLLFIELNFLLI